MAGITYPNIPYGDMSYVDKINQNFSEIDTQLEGILTDETKTLYGLPVSAVPDDVLAIIKQLLDGKAKITTGSFTPNGATRTISLGINARFVLALGSPSYSTTQQIHLVTSNGRIDGIAGSTSGSAVLCYPKASGDYISGSTLYLGTSGINYTAGTAGTVYWTAIG